MNPPFLYILIIAYDGTCYKGFQKTTERADANSHKFPPFSRIKAPEFDRSKKWPILRQREQKEFTGISSSIAAEIERVLCCIFQENVLVYGASRTDAGVHAEYQVVTVCTTKSHPPIQKLYTSINQLLPNDITCCKIILSPYIDFHPSLHVEEKTYRYGITLHPYQMPFDRRTHWHIYTPVDTTILQNAIDLFIGTKDFFSFINNHKELSNKNTIRTISSIIIRSEKNNLYITIKGKSFLYKMIRNIVGSMIQLAQGKITKTALIEAFSQRNRTLSGITAPAHGLTLEHISYIKPYATIFDEKK